jgi:hypothetical protein
MGRGHAVKAAQERWAKASGLTFSVNRRRADSTDTARWVA